MGKKSKDDSIELLNFEYQFRDLGAKVYALNLIAFSIGVFLHSDEQGRVSFQAHNFTDLDDLKGEARESEKSMINLCGACAGLAAGEILLEAGYQYHDIIELARQARDEFESFSSLRSLTDIDLTGLAECSQSVEGLLNYLTHDGITAIVADAYNEEEEKERSVERQAASV